MSNFNWLSHGGPGSGRYPKGSGKNPRKAYKTLKRVSKRGAFVTMENQYKKISKYLSPEQKQSLNNTKNNYLKIDRRITNYETGEYLKGTSAKDIKKHQESIRLHGENAKKIAEDVLGKYGNRSIKVSDYAEWKRNKWVAKYINEKANEQLAYILRVS